MKLFFFPCRSSERNKIVLITQSNLLLSQGLLVLKKTHIFVWVCGLGSVFVSSLVFKRSWDTLSAPNEPKYCKLFPDVWNHHYCDFTLWIQISANKPPGFSPKLVRKYTDENTLNSPASMQWQRATVMWFFYCFYRTRGSGSVLRLGRRMATHPSLVITSLM